MMDRKFRAKWNRRARFVREFWIGFMEEGWPEIVENKYKLKSLGKKKILKARNRL